MTVITGISALDKTLVGEEVAAGDATTPTTYWRGTGIMKDTRVVTFPKQRVGRIGGTTRSWTGKTGGAPVLEDDAAFEALGHIFNAAFYKTTPTTDTGSSGYIYAWSAQSASTDPMNSTDLATMVIETGDNIQAEIAHFCYVHDYVLSGKEGEAVHIVANFESQAPTTTTFTAVSDTDLTLEYETILNNRGTMYIDPSTDAAGTSIKSTTLIDWSLKHTTGWVPMPAKDGRTDFSDIKHIDDEILLDVTFEHNSIAVTEKAAWRNETERVLRLKFTGDALSTTDGGAAYDTKALILDMYGKWLTFGAEGLEDANGDNTYRGQFQVRYAEAGLAKFNVTLVTEQATLP